MYTKAIKAAKRARTIVRMERKCAALRARADHLSDLASVGDLEIGLHVLELQEDCAALIGTYNTVQVRARREKWKAEHRDRVNGVTSALCDLRRRFANLHP